MATGQMTAAQKRYQDYLRSPRWRILRTIRRRIDANHCRICYAEGPLDVHHRTYRHRGKSFVGELRDTITLCRDCHRIYHDLGYIRD